MLEGLFNEAEEKMDKAVAAVDHELTTLRTGRASASMVEGVQVQAYGSAMPINQVATISTPDASTIAVQPWDAGLLATIEKALLAANLGMTPSNDGKIIRLRVPSLTEETRKEMVKKAHAVAEQGRIAVRNIRRHANDHIKANEKEHEITEDDKKKFLDQIQKKTDAHVKRIDELMAKKEKEIMTV